MTIGAVYASDLSRVRISCSAAPALADYAVIERSVDQITWVSVRGGEQVALNAGACALDDYEFVAGQANYYRATYVDSATPFVVNFGTLGSAVNASVNPGMPAGVQEGDLLILKAAIRNTTGFPDLPPGWSILVDGFNFRVFTRTYTAGVVAPTVTFTAGVAGADTGAKILAVRNANPSVAHTLLSNASAQDVLAPAIAVAPITPNMLLRIAWKQSLTTLSAMTGWTALSRDSMVAGDDQTFTWWWKATSADEPQGTFVMTGGVAALSKATTIRFTRKPYLLQETANVTPVLTEIWMKNLGKPFLNRTLTVTDFSEVVQPSRSGSFAVVARRLSVAVTEVRGGNQYTLTMKTETDSEVDDLKAVLSLGEVVFLHMPHDCKIFPGGYYLPGNLTTRRALPSARSPRRYHELVLEEVAAPSSVIIGTTVLWSNVISSFATWGDLMAAEPTWGDVMSRIGTPADVVVP